MKTYILVVLLLIAFVGCQDTNNQAVKDIKEKTPDMEIEESETISEIEEEDSLEDEQIIGKWISHVKDSFGGESISLYMFDDGTLLTNDFKLAGLENKEYSSYLSGTWKNNGDSILFSIDKQMILDFESGIVEEKIDKVLVTLDILDISDQLLVINEQAYEKSGSLIGVGSNDFKGKWSRTEVHKAHGGYLNILEVNSNYMIFSAELYYGGNTGIALGIAVFDSENEAEYIHTDKSYDSQEVVDIRFKLVDDSLFVESNHNPDLGFGMNVYIDGEYIKGEPEYTNKNVLIDTFYSQDRIDIMKDFLGEESWRFLFHVIDYGFSYETDLTYSGFVAGLGQGADFLMTDDNKIYYLSYGEGPTNVFYTNDEKYKNIIPRFMLDKVRAFNNMKFIYKNDNDEIITDNYVWVRGHYEKPSSWNDSNIIIWDNQEASEYLEIIVNGSIENLCLVVFEDGLVDGEPVISKVVHKLDNIKDQTVVVKVNQPEGIPYQAIRFENNGERYYYIIQENSLSGEADALNEHIFHIGAAN